MDPARPHYQLNTDKKGHPIYVCSKIKTSYLK